MFWLRNKNFFFWYAPLTISLNRDASGFLGAREKGYLFIFRELGSTGNYFMGVLFLSVEQAHAFGGLGSTAKKKGLFGEISAYGIKAFKITQDA